MPRTRAAENSQFLPKSIPLDKIETGIGRLQEVLVAINDFSQDGFPYRDAARTKAELQLRECVKQVFGERSQEFQTYRNYTLRTSSQAEVAQSIAAVKGLIQTLENKKLEIQGVKPPPIVAPEAEKISPATTAQIRLVPPTAQVAIATQPAGAASPMTVSVAMTTNLGTPASPPATIAEPSPPAPKPQTPPAPASPMPLTPINSSASSPPANAPVAWSTAPTPKPAAVSAAPAPAVSATQEIRRAPVQPADTPIPTPILPAQPSAVTEPLDVPSVQPLSEQQTLALVRKVCLRLHSVARQLRLRKDSRPTVEVEDDYDLQDLLRALLKMEFDEVGTDEWTPPYAGSLPRTMLLLNREQIAIVAKKTRPGLTAKEIADQVAADSAFYSAHKQCTTLFCFVYDPEGRIGSPKRLEADLTSVSDRCTVEVLVAPK